ncbi:hypothetical protein O6H91_04G060100 [Diphasiastrum complanatum]|uniref:Uncharacterized protein n=1 Tax=Diphasiastrum complanatum TaxID=34168 RepID=A0ACC2DXC5_DIPCM|nr:hypothetical protein O6H91_04G060100 [Diphasiastrum complanatum]
MTPTKGLKIRLKRKGDAFAVAKVGKISAEGDHTGDVQTNAEETKGGLLDSHPPSISISPVSSDQDAKEEQGSKEETLTKKPSVPVDLALSGNLPTLLIEGNDQKLSIDRSGQEIDALPVINDSGMNAEGLQSQGKALVDTSSAVINGELPDQGTHKHPDLEQVRTVAEDSPACSSGLNMEVCSPKVPVPSVQQEPLTRELYRIPSYAGWFAWNKIHTTERRALSEFFEGKSPSKTPKIYKDYRDFIINRYRDNPQKPLTFTEVRKMLIGDVNCIRKVFEFLDQWGLINYHVAAGEKPIIATMSSFPLPEPSSSGLELVFPALTSESSLPSTYRTGPIENRGLQFATLASHENLFNLSTRDESLQGKFGHKRPLSQDLSTDTNAEDSEEIDLTQKDALKEGGTPTQAEPEENENLWTQEETIHLLEGISKYGENWNRVAEHVGTKSKTRCILQFIQLPYADSLTNDMDSGMSEITSTSTESKVNAPEEAMLVSNSVGSCVIPPMKKQKSGHENDPNNDKEMNGTMVIPSSCTSGETVLTGQEYASPYGDASNPLISQVAFMSAVVGPRVAAAAAQAALTVLSEEDPALSLLSVSAITAQTVSEKDSTPTCLNQLDSLKDVPNSHRSDGDGDKSSKQDSGLDSRPLKEPLPSAVQVRTSCAVALAAAAANAKLLADQEEREIEHLMASIIENQLKKLHSKLEHFEELEFLLEKERMQLEQARLQVFADRLKLAQQQFSVGSIPGQHRLPDFSRRI